MDTSASQSSADGSEESKRIQVGRQKNLDSDISKDISGGSSSSSNRGDELTNGLDEIAARLTASRQNVKLFCPSDLIIAGWSLEGANHLYGVCLP